MPAEHKAKAASAPLSPGRGTTARSTSITPPKENSSLAPQPLPHRGVIPLSKPSSPSKPRVPYPFSKAKPVQPVLRQASNNVRLTSKPSYAAQRSAAVATPKLNNTAHLSTSGGVSPRRPIVLNARLSADSPRTSKAPAATSRSCQSPTVPLIQLHPTNVEERNKRSSSEPCKGVSGSCGTDEAELDPACSGARFEVVALANQNGRGLLPSAEAPGAKHAISMGNGTPISGSATPRSAGDSMRSQGDDITVAIAAARLAASRGSLAASTGRSRAGSGEARGKDRELELYVDCAVQRWRVWCKEAAPDEGGAQASEDKLAPRAASFAGQLLWEHDRAILEAERCNACAAEAKREAERAEEALSRTALAEQQMAAKFVVRSAVKSYAWTKHANCSAQHTELAALPTVGEDAQSRQLSSEIECLQMTCTETADRFEGIQQAEQRCAQELNYALVRCEEAEASCYQKQQDKLVEHESFLEAECALKRKHDAFDTIGSRMERLESEMLSETEVVQALRNEMKEHSTTDDQRASELASQLAHMTTLYDAQTSELQEMILRSEDRSTHVAAVEPPQAPRHQSERTEPNMPTEERVTALEQEVGGLQGLVRQLAEELGRMHEAHAELAADRETIHGEKLAALSRLEVAETENDALAEEVLRLRITRGQEPAIGREATFGYPGRIKTRATVPQTANRTTHNLLAEALDRENRRLRRATRAVCGSFGN